MKYILGVDIGTGSVKAVAVAEGGEILATTQYHYPTQSPEPGASEQDAELIWQHFVKCVNQACAQLDEPPTSIGLSSAFHSLICADNDGNALAPMMTWADRRAATVAETIKASAESENLYRTSGTPIHPMSPLCKLVWLREHRNELFKRSEKFISIKEYIWYKLFGVFEIDYSIASATGLFDIIALDWNEGALKLSGINKDQLSAPINTTQQRTGITASVAVQLGIPADTVFVAGAGDGCCANLGSGVSATGTAALTIGTSGAVRITGAKPVFDFSAMIFNYLLDEQTFVSGGAVNNGGIAVNWLLKNFLNKANPTPADYEKLFADIDTIPAGSEGLIFLPYLYGERAPIWNASASGSFLNVLPQHTQNHFLRAGIEGICYALNDVLTQLEKSSKTTIDQINISGGFISSPVWVQLLADVTGKKLVAVQEEDASAVGAVYLAAMALFGGYGAFVKTDHNAAATTPDEQKHKVYVDGFERYKQYSRAISAINSTLLSPPL